VYAGCFIAACRIAIVVRWLGPDQYSSAMALDLQKRRGRGFTKGERHGDEDQ